MKQYLETFITLKKVKQFLLAFCLMLPSLFIPVSNSHEWGDDDAQYIHQGINIANGIPQTQTGYLFNPSNAMLGPQAYPAGFPLMLSAVFKIYGTYTISFVVFMFAVTFICALLAYLYFSKYFSHLTSLILMLFLFYHPWVMNFRNEIMADIPFTALVLCFLIIWYECKKWWHFLFAGILAGFIITVKEIGWALSIAAMHSIFIKRANQPFAGIKNSKNWIYGLSFLPAVFLTWYLIEHVIFKIPRPYDENFNIAHPLSTISANLHYYLTVLQGFFYSDSGEFNFIPSIVSPVLFTFVIMGIYKRFSKGLELTEWFILIYFSVLLIYPYHNSGFRFLLPLAPVLLVYMTEGIKTFNPLPAWPLKTKLILFFIIIAIQYSLSYSGILFYSGKIMAGPQESSSIQMFEHMKIRLPKDSRIAFSKPRALALYTPFSSIGLQPEAPVHITDSILKTNNINYILLCSDLEDNSLRDYIQIYPEKSKIIHSNAKFELYELIKMQGQ